MSAKLPHHLAAIALTLLASGLPTGALAVEPAEESVILLDAAHDVTWLVGPVLLEAPEALQEIRNDTVGKPPAFDVRQVAVSETPDEVELRLRLAALPPHGSACEGLDGYFAPRCGYGYHLYMNYSRLSDGWTATVHVMLQTRCLKPPILLMPAECGDLRIVQVVGERQAASHEVRVTRVGSDTFQVSLSRTLFQPAEEWTFLGPARVCAGDFLSDYAFLTIGFEDQGANYYRDDDAGAWKGPAFEFALDSPGCAG